MKKISLLDFRELCESRSFDTFIFYTDNQPWGSVDDTICLEVIFESIIIGFNPNIIYLTGKGGSVKFNKVRTIRIHECGCLLGEVFTVVCDGCKDNNNIIKEYTLIAR